MNKNSFQQQISRLVETFGANHYKPERINLIWGEIQDLSDWWMAKTMDRFIGELRQPPLMVEFREEISKERERLWKIEKAKNEKDAKDFYSGTYAPEDKKTICQMISKRLQGKVSDAEYATFIEHLEHAAKNPSEKINHVACRDCDDRGIVWDKENYVFKCYCAQGSKRQEKYPIYSRQR